MYGLTYSLYHPRGDEQYENEHTTTDMVLQIHSVSYALKIDLTQYQPSASCQWWLLKFLRCSHNGGNYKIHTPKAHTFWMDNYESKCILLTLTLPGPSAGVSGSLDSYCSLKPLCSGMGEVVPARTSPTLLPHPLALCCHYPVSKGRSASIAVTGTLRVNTVNSDYYAKGRCEGFKELAQGSRMWPQGRQLNPRPSDLWSSVLPTKPQIPTYVTFGLNIFYSWQNMTKDWAEQKSYV